MLRLNGVEVELQDFRLKDTSFQVEPGKCLVIVGPSGAGKTILLDTIAGVHRPKRGSIILEGQDITYTLPEQRKIGYLPQSLALFPHLSVMDNILFGARARKLPLDQARARARELAALLKIEHLLDRRSPLTLSGGEKQRVALARTLLVQPSVVLLDEPFSALDGFIRKKLVLYLKEVFTTLKTTAVYVTHDLQEAFLLGDHIGVMLDGKLQQVGTREEVYYRPATLGIATLFAGCNRFKGKIIDNIPGTSLVVKTPGGFTFELPWKENLKKGQKVIFGINPREVAVTPEDNFAAAGGKANILEATVKKIFTSFDSCFVFLALKETGEEVELEMPGHIIRDKNITPGSTLSVYFKKDSMWVLPEAI